MGSKMTVISSVGADRIGIFPALFVEPVATKWVLPTNHYDAGRQISVETETGLPAFQYQAASTGTVTGSTSSSSSDSQMGINRGTDDSSSDSDFD
ncbi:MAG: hypothetical protein A2V88_17950 [Elusimicrobia bacterium RBG_16_66_12]|nr:MAG: hypothetical protein A2V88_17950 [Elusimicrobia bacterium RBG_16_66_12]